MKLTKVLSKLHCIE